MERKVLLAAAVICLTAGATASAGGTKHAPPAKAKCAISKVSFKGGSIVAIGGCTVQLKVKVRKHIVTKAKATPAKWVATENDSDASGFACGGTHTLLDNRIFLGATRPYKITGRFVLSARNRPSNRAAKSFSFVFGGNFFQCGPQPPEPPDPVATGLCQWKDAPVPSCGVPVAGKDNCFWSGPAGISGNTISTGTIACPANANGGFCQYISAGDPSKPPPTVIWLGYPVQLVYLTCSDGLWAGLAISAVKLEGPNKTCMLGGKDNVQSFRVKPEWGGRLYVSFLLEVNIKQDPGYGDEYETAVFDLHGTKDACTELGLG